MTGATWILLITLFAPSGQCTRQQFVSSFETRAKCLDAAKTYIVPDDSTIDNSYKSPLAAVATCSKGFAGIGTAGIAMSD